MSYKVFLHKAVTIFFFMISSVSILSLLFSVLMQVHIDNLLR